MINKYRSACEFAWLKTFFFFAFNRLSKATPALKTESLQKHIHASSQVATRLHPWRQHQKDKAGKHPSGAGTWGQHRATGQREGPSAPASCIQACCCATLSWHVLLASHQMTKQNKDHPSLKICILFFFKKHLAISAIGSQQAVLDGAGSGPGNVNAFNSQQQLKEAESSLGRCPLNPAKAQSPSLLPPYQ